MHSSGFHSLPSRSPTHQQAASHPSIDLHLSMPTSNVYPTVTAAAAKPTIRHSGSVPSLQYSTTDHMTTRGQFNSTRTSTHLHDFQKQLNESTLKSSRDALATDLEKSKYQIKEFEGRVSKICYMMQFVCAFDQVSLLDSQLKQKSSMMEEYVTELSQLRTEIARIKKNQEKEISKLKEENSRELEEVSCWQCCHQLLLTQLSSTDEDYTQLAVPAAGSSGDTV